MTISNKIKNESAKRLVEAYEDKIPRPEEMTDKQFIEHCDRLHWKQITFTYETKKLKQEEEIARQNKIKVFDNSDFE